MKPCDDRNELLVQFALNQLQVTLGLFQKCRNIPSNARLPAVTAPFWLLTALRLSIPPLRVRLKL